MPLKAILLDWDGTIIDGFPLLHDAMNDTLVRYGHAPWDDTMAALHIPRPDKEKFPEIFGDQWEEALSHYYAALTRIGEQIEKPKLIPGAEHFMEFLQDARRKGIYVGIVSNSRTAAIQRELRQSGWENYVDVIVASDSGMKNKPDPEAYAKALEHCPHTNLLSNEVVYIGDANTDLQFARNTGMKFIGIGEKFTLPMEPGEHAANLHTISTRLRHAMRDQSPNQNR